ncbi:dermonecrotic toxin domain-containing protein [Pseudomonas edaphica]|uniref:dermonecrotic toxin domain-containing protein n=1 Tax=Pseudomonas edaphica TaxID=2006980 RepID=UPI003D125710
MSTDTTAWLAAEAAAAQTLNFDDPQTSDAQRDAAIRTLLTRRLNAVTQPSLEINRLYEAQARAREAVKLLKDLIGRAPRVLGIIRGALRKAFALDPDTLLFTEFRPPPLPQKVYSLTEKGLALLIDPDVPLDINQFTTLRIKDEPARTLPFTAWDALVRVKGLALLGQVEKAERDYWQQLAYGSWLTRKQRWVQLRKSLFAEHALLAHRVYQLSDRGYAMVRKVMEIPGADARRRAAGDWASIQVSRVAWPGTNRALVPVPGALYIYREGIAGDTPHVIYLPGLIREFYEFSSWYRMQCDLPALVNGPLSQVLWQCLPLRRWHELCNTPSVTPQAFTLQLIGVHQEDVLLASATELLEAQWDNEVACALSINPAAVGVQGVGQFNAPEVKRFLKFIEKGRRRLACSLLLGNSLDALPEWDHQRRSGEIVCASLTPDLALKTREAQLKRSEKGLMALLDPTDVGKSTAPYQDFLNLEQRWQAQVSTASQLAHGPHERMFEKAFWLEQPLGTSNRGSLVGTALRRALLLEAQMQQQLNLMPSVHLERLNTVLSESWVPGDSAADTCVLQVTVGSESDPLYPLLGASLVTTNQALAHPNGPHSVLLCVTGLYGALVPFDNLNAFAEGLQTSLKSPDGSVLWRCIGRDQREVARAAITALPRNTALVVNYEAIKRPLLKDWFTKLMQHYAALNKLAGKGVRLFSEMSDPQLSRMLLAQELFECLQVPANDARTLALSNINLLRVAATQAKKLPSWLGYASSGSRKHYKRLSRRYLTNAFAVESKLWRDLPSLESFARNALIARLTQDGFYPQLDIDKPLLDLPDDVSSQLCGSSSQCVVGDRDIKMVVSSQRTTFSMLQLALHNLDPKAPWTRWRLNRARWLDLAWKERLSVRYLIDTLSSLDLGGAYDKLILEAFYPPASSPATSPGLSQALVYRALQQRAQMQLYSAVQQGLGEKGQRLFTLAMAARSASDLKKDGLDVQLAVLRLMDAASEHDRHIAGLLFIHDRLSKLCVVYWPMAAASRVIVAYASLAEAEKAMNLVGALPENQKVLARQVAPGWEAQALDRYPDGDLGVRLRQPHWREPGQTILYRFVAALVEFFWARPKIPRADQESVEALIKEQIESQPEHWLAAAPTATGNAMLLLAHAQVFELQRRTQAQSQSSQTLEQYREQRLGEQHDATIRGLLGFVPVLGVGISLYEMLLAARRYHYSGSAHDAVDVGFLTILAFVDVLTSFGPSPKGARVSRVALGRLHRHQGFMLGARTGLKPSPIKPRHLLEHFQSPVGLDGAVELAGPGGKGRYAKNGQQFIREGNDVYPIYQRENERGLRLKKSQGGGQDELTLNIEHPREWLLGADAPKAGPSSGVHNPWRAPTPPSPDWHPPVIRTATENRIYQSTTLANHWLDWRTQVSADQLSGSPAPWIFHLALDPQGYPHNVLRVAPPNTSISDPNSGFYRVLPPGDHAPLTGIVFITRNEPLVSLAEVDIVRWTGRDRRDQPLPVSRTLTGGWQNHPPLFDRPLQQYVAEAFPTMTNRTRDFVVLRMIELSGPSRPATASHMLGLRAALDEWLPPAPARPGQTDDLLRMLRPIPIARNTTFINYQGVAPGLERIDFIPSIMPAKRLQHGGKAVTVDRHTTQRAAVRSVLEQQGFIIRDVNVWRYGKSIRESLVTHPNSPARLYYVSYEWAEMGNVRLYKRFENKWFDLALRSYKDPALVREVTNARFEQRLVPILAGIHWPIMGDISPTVYFVKLRPAS